MKYQGKSAIRILATLCISLFLAGKVLSQDSSTQPAPPPTPQQRVAMLKQWLAASQTQLRAYEWIETTVISKGGEEKARKQNSCYYGVDGKLQKVPVAGGTSQEESHSGPMLPPARLLAKASAHKKEEMVEYMKQAKALIDSYIPPDPDRIQKVVNAGNMAVNMIAPGQRVRLDFKNYLKSGDVLSVDIELTTNRLLGVAVSSYIEKPSDAVSLNVSMGVLPDGTIYTAHSTLNAAAKDVTVVVDNTGHRR